MKDDNNNIQKDIPEDITPENSDKNLNGASNPENEQVKAEQVPETTAQKQSEDAYSQPLKKDSAPAYGIPNEGNRYEYPYRRQAETPNTGNYTPPPYQGYQNTPQNNNQAYNGWTPAQNQGQYTPPANYQYSQQNHAPQDNRNFANGRYYQQSQYSAPRETAKPKKSKSSLGGGAVALIICCTLIFSTVFGAFGMLGGMYLAGSGEVTPTNNVKSGDENSVIYQSVTSEDNPYGDRNENAITYVNQIASPTVVEITTESLINSYYYGQYVSEGAGSGVIITSDGYIITNNHVIADTTAIKVTLNDGTQYDATLIGTDSQTDIALIKINATDLPFATLGDSSNLVVGETVVAIGNPLGQLGGTLTDGIISALDREITIDNETMTLLQTNVAVNPGNSGGGLFNIKGELIGIVNAKKSGTDIEGIGFAIPINTAKETVDQLLEYGYVKGRVVLGIDAREINDATTAWMYRVNEYGVYVTGVRNGDFNVGDRIMAIDSKSISSFSDIKKILRSHSVGDEVTVTVSRSGRMVDIKVTLIEYVPTDAQSNVVQSSDESA